MPLQWIVSKLEVRESLLLILLFNAVIDFPFGFHAVLRFAVCLRRVVRDSGHRRWDRAREQTGRGQRLDNWSDCGQN